MNTINNVSNLFDINYLSTIFYNISSVKKISISTNGCSASNFYSLIVKTTDSTHRLIVKEIDTRQDWLSLRSNDEGREAILLSSSQINLLWEIIENPYLVIAKENRQYALLMKDLSKQLDVFYQMDIENKDNIAIETLAKIHASFWRNETLSEESALMRLPNYFLINGPNNNYSDTNQAIGRKILRGWDEAKKLLSQRTYNWLTKPVNQIAQLWDNYPNTLLHGDYRPMNLGYSYESKKMIIIDWAFSGFGPCTIDLYWYVASTSQFRDDNEKPIKLYRNFLEKELKQPIADQEWEKLKEIGIVSSCYMLLWQKALNYHKYKADLDWWVKKLEEIIDKH